MVYYDFYQTPQRTSDEEKHFHPRMINQGTIDISVLSREIEKSTTLTAPDVEAALSAITDHMKMHLMNGERVYLKGLGYFSISLQCTKPDCDPERTRAESIQFKSLNFKADQFMRNELKAIESKRISRKKPDGEINKELVSMLVPYLKTHKYISRHQVERLCNLTRMTALRRLKVCVNNNILKNLGTRFNPVYVPGENFPSETVETE